MGFKEIRDREIQNLNENEKIKSLEKEIHEKYKEFLSLCEEYENLPQYKSEKEKVFTNAIKDFKDYFIQLKFDFKEKKQHNFSEIIVYKNDFNIKLTIRDSEQILDMEIRNDQGFILNETITIEDSKLYIQEFNGFYNNNRNEVEFNQSKIDSQFLENQLLILNNDIDSMNRKFSNISVDFELHLYGREINVHNMKEFLNIIDKEID